MILKGRAYGSGSGAKVGLLHTFILEHCWRRFQRITSVRTDHRLSARHGSDCGIGQRRWCFLGLKELG